jgi:hypothetical protein
VKLLLVGTIMLGIGFIVGVEMETRFCVSYFQGK